MGLLSLLGGPETSTHFKCPKHIAGELISAVSSNVKHGIYVLALVLERSRIGLSAQGTWFCDNGTPTHVQIDEFTEMEALSWCDFHCET